MSERDENASVTGSLSRSRSTSTSNAMGALRRASVNFMEAPMSSFFSTSTTAMTQAPMTISQLQEPDDAPPLLVRRSSLPGTPVTPTGGTSGNRRASKTGYFEGERVSEEGVAGSSTETGAPRGSHSIEVHREPTIAEVAAEVDSNIQKQSEKNEEQTQTTDAARRDSLDDYEPEPPKLTKGQAVKKGLLAYWKFLLTIKGFLITIYFLLVVAWGGMIFLLLCGAANSEMCHGFEHDCNSNKNSPKSIWIEIDSQVLNGLFCVTGFGLIPWRLRDLIFLMQYRIQHKRSGLDKLATINKGWFRIDDHGPRRNDYIVPKEAPQAANGNGTDGHDLETVPTNSSFHPLHRITRTGLIAPASRYWLMDLVVWFNVGNTLLQGCLAGVMWGLTRYNRPSATTAIFIVFAFGCGIGVGVITLIEGNRIKKIEGRALVRKVLVVDDCDFDMAVEKQKKSPFFRRHF